FSTPARMLPAKPASSSQKPTPSDCRHGAAAHAIRSAQPVDRPPAVRGSAALTARQLGGGNHPQLPAALPASERQKENWPPGCLGASLSCGSCGAPRCGVKCGALGAASPTIICHSHAKRQRPTGVSESVLQLFRVSAQLRGNVRSNAAC